MKPILRRYIGVGHIHNDVVMVGTSLDGTTKYSVRKTDGIWEYVIENFGQSPFVRSVWGKWELDSREIYKCEPYLPDGEHYKRLRVATTENFNGEI